MPFLDLSIIFVYLLGMLLVGGYFSRKRGNSEQFTSANGTIPGWAIGVSIYATFLSSNTFLGVPGKSFGGDWNGFVFSLSMPLAAWVAAKYFVPFYRTTGEVSAYTHLEHRFGPWARTYAVVCFLLTQLARMGSIFFGIALSLQALTGFSMNSIMIVVGLCIILYTVMGGIEAVIWTEVVQAVIKTFGALLIIYVVIKDMPGGFSRIMDIGSQNHKFSLGSFAPDFKHSTFWVILLYGFFINLNNFGMDQNYVQRYHAARSSKAATRSLWLCVGLYVPASLLFFFIGSCLFSYYSVNPDALTVVKEQVARERLPLGAASAQISQLAATLKPADYGDKVMPNFIVTRIPTGLSGLIIAAILSAAMSTISSGMNASATVFSEDIYRRYFNHNATEKQKLRILYIGTVAFGLAGMAAGVAMIGSQGILDMWWELSGIFAAGMLGIFLLGIFSKRTFNQAAIIAAVIGVLIIFWMTFSGQLPEELGVLRSPFHKNMIIVIGTLSIFLTGVLVTKWSPPTPPKMAYQEIQLTNDPAGHCINSTQCWSPDDQWIVFDSRNTDAGIISAGTIAAIKVSNKEIKTLYNTKGQTNFGPGVGAVTWSPLANRVLFIHGIRNAGRDKPYGATRRTGVAIDFDKPFEPIWMDARDIHPPFTPGALRGGTHAHTWSGDGQWISFTYNDYLLEQAEKAGSAVKDLRTVGVMAPGKKVIVRNEDHYKNNDSLEDNNGELFAFPIAWVIEDPAPGTDAIDKAFDECWIGRNGYRKADGTLQHRAIAFQGNLRETDGTRKTEIFVADISDTVVATAAAMPPETDPTRRLPVPPGIIQRRISFTKKGVSPIPRHWLRSTPDGALIGFLAADQRDTIQLFGISPNGGAVHALTHNAFSITGPFNFSPDGKFVAYAGDNSVWITELAGGHTERVTERSGDGERPDGAVVWSNDGSMLCYNRRIKTDKEGFWQIFVLKRK